MELGDTDAPHRLISYPWEKFPRVQWLGLSAVLMFQTLKVSLDDQTWDAAVASSDCYATTSHPSSSSQCPSLSNIHSPNPYFKFYKILKENMFLLQILTLNFLYCLAISIFYFLYWSSSECFTCGIIEGEVIFIIALLGVH